jgi:hypothetical protein
MKKYCAFGALTPWRFGEVISTDEKCTIIQPEFQRRKEYWETSYVKFFDTEEEARTENKKWITQRDEY